MAQNPSLIIRVAANIAELRANLLEGKNQIEVTTAAMKRMADSFSGERLIMHAHNVVAAVNEIGGASRLTEAEQARVNATLEKALEKYRVLGKEAPAAIRQLADATKGTDTASRSLSETVRGLATDFLAMFTARAAFTFVKDILDEASALQDLSNQTHINIEDIQLLAGAMSEFGVDAETLAKGLYRLSRGIASGDDSVANGLHLMGLALKDVEGLQGKELFLKIEAGLATLQGGLRDTAAAELFGGKLGAAMAGASEGIEGALETWQRLNHVASAESVAAMDTFGESIARANKNLSSIAANMIGPVAQGFNVLFDAVDHGASTWAITWAMVKDAAMSTLPGLGQSTVNLTRLLDAQNRVAETNAAAHRATAQAHVQVKAAVDERTAAEKFMAALEADAAVALTATQLKNLEHLKAIGELTAKNAAGIGVSAAQFKLYEETMKAAAEAEKTYRDFQVKSHEIAMKAIRDETAEQFKAMQARNKEIIDAALQIKAIQDQQAEDVRRRTMSDTEFQIDQARRVAEYEIATFKGTAAQFAVYEDLKRQELAKTVAALTAAMQGYIDVTFAGARSLARPQGLERGPSIQEALNPRQHGGPVAAQTPYLVGERGPEVFVPQQSGRIVPNGGASITVPITINGSVLSDETKIARAVGDALVGRLRAMGVRLPLA